LRIDAALKSDLMGWCRQRNVTPAMAVFTAYVAAVLRTCDVPEAVFQFQIDGRGDERLENTVGYFASRLCLRLDLFDRDTFDDLVQKVVAEYCRAYQHADRAYLASRASPPVFTKNTAFNWIPFGAAQGHLPPQSGSKGDLRCAPVRFVPVTLRRMQHDSEPEVVIRDLGTEIVGNIYFARSRLTPATAHRLGRNFLAFIQALTGVSGRAVSDLPFAR
jgi:non-ribosomal peptide synthetase component F